MNDLAYASVEDVNKSLEVDGSPTNRFAVLAAWQFDVRYEDVTANQVKSAIMRYRYVGGVELPDWEARKIATNFNRDEFFRGEFSQDWDWHPGSGPNCRSTYGPFYGQETEGRFYDNKTKTTYSKKRSPRNRRSRK